MLKRVDQYEVEWGVPRILSVGANSSSSAVAASGSAEKAGGPPSSSTLIVRVRTCRGRHGTRRVRWHCDYGGAWVQLRADESVGSEEVRAREVEAQRGGWRWPCGSRRAHLGVGDAALQALFRRLERLLGHLVMFVLDLLVAHAAHVVAEAQLAVVVVAAEDRDLSDNAGDDLLAHRHLERLAEHEAIAGSAHISRCIDGCVLCSSGGGQLPP